MSRTVKEGELYNLPGGAGWCRHGLVMIHRIVTTAGPRLIACDTYWGSPNFGALERNFYELDQVADRLEFLLDLNTARLSHEDEWKVYADEDRAYIPMGGSGVKYYVRKDARPNRGRQIERLEYLIRQERSRAESATRWADGYEQELRELRKKEI